MAVASILGLNMNTLLKVLRDALASNETSRE